ncbi:ccr4 associated factor [Loxospora ochrophaea]|nr:ccr4 associated factor [Loxospora ochrophaea]
MPTLTPRCPKLPSLPRQTYFRSSSVPVSVRFRSTSLNSLSPPPPSGYAHLPTRRLISLTGSDAAQFLQGLTTANISPTTTTGIYSGFLNAQGRVLHDVFICPLSQPHQHSPNELGFLIEVDASEQDRLARWLQRYKLRAKVAIRPLDPTELAVWSTWDERHSHEHEHTPSNTPPPQVIEFADSRAPGMGRRIFSPGGTIPPSVAGSEASLDQYTLRRMMKGVPEGQREISRETALPQESCMDYMGAIDFRKGCYVGQELTIRTQHTGVVRKRILPVQLYAPGTAPPDSLEYRREFSDKLLPPSSGGSNIVRVDGKGRSAGKWIGGVGNVGLALCRLEVMTETVLTAEGGLWKEGDEFMVRWKEEQEEGTGGQEREVRLKAFIPSWHRERAAGLNVRRG